MQARHRKPTAVTVRKPPVPQARAVRWRRILVLAGGLLIVVAAIGGVIYYRAHHRQPAARPVIGNGLSVLLITVDTTRADYLGCYGRPEGRTPNMDALARQGALFERCYTCAPLTGPSHASIMTGDYPYVHGVRTNSAAPLSAANVTLAEVLKDSGYQTAATVASAVLNREFGFAQGFDTFHDVNEVAGEESSQAERKGDEISRDAITLLKTLAPAPFFLWVHFYDPHHPYETRRPAPYSTAQAYEDEVAFMDEQIGQVLAEVNHLGLDRRTAVVLVGDHGEGLGEHGQSQHSFFLYNSTLHVPLMVRCPRAIAAGTSFNQVVRTIDVAPTILALLGLPSRDRVQGADLLGLARGEIDHTPRAAYCETLEARAQFGVSRLRGLIDGDWLYVLAPKPELYNLVTDPAEAAPLMAELPDRAARMRERLRTIIAESPAPVAASGAAALSDVDRERLESLGYAGSAAHRDESGRNELELFEPEGANPLEFAPQFELTLAAADLTRAGDYAAASQTLQQVITVLPDAPRPAGLLATMLAKEGRPQEAIPIFERVLKLIPEDNFTRGSYGIALMHAGRLQAAADQLAIVLRENPSNARILNNLAAALTQLGRFEEADRHLQLALQLQPRNPLVLHALGILRCRQNRLPEAERYLSDALQIDPGSGPCQEDLARVRAAMPLRRP